MNFILLRRILRADKFTDVFLLHEHHYVESKKSRLQPRSYMCSSDKIMKSVFFCNVPIGYDNVMCTKKKKLMLLAPDFLQCGEALSSYY